MMIDPIPDLVKITVYTLVVISLFFTVISIGMKVPELIAMNSGWKLTISLYGTLLIILSLLHAMFSLLSKLGDLDEGKPSSVEKNE